MTKRDSFIFYRSFFEAIADIDPKDQSEVFRAICEYALNGKTVKLKGVPSAIFKLISPQLDANQKRYENGKGGGRPSSSAEKPREINKNGKTKTKPNNNQTETKTKPNNNQTETKAKPNVNENENDNANGDMCVSKSIQVDNGADARPHTPHTHTAPTPDEVKARLREIGKDTDIGSFIAYNTARGWPLEWTYALDRWIERDRSAPVEVGKTVQDLKRGRFQGERKNNYDEMERNLISAQRARCADE